MLLGGGSLFAAATIQAVISAGPAHAQASGKPNVLVIWGDDIGTWNISFNNRGMMGYETPNIDRIGREGLAFTDYYGQQSCTAGRAAFIGGNVPVRTGMTKVGLPGAKEGWQKTDVTMATVMKSQGYATGQFGKNHQGDRDEHLPTMHGFDEFFGNLYHLNAEEEPENRDYPKDLVLANGKKFVEAAGGEEAAAKLDQLFGQAVESVRTELFSINPKQSYVDEATINADPDFWKPKAAAKAQSATTKPTAATPAKSSSR